MSTRESDAVRRPRDLQRDRVLVVSLDPGLSMNARVLRQVEFLATEFDVVVAGRARPPVDGVEFLQLSPGGSGSRRERAEAAVRAGLRTAGRYGAAYWRDARVRRWRDELAQALPVDAIVVNDPFVLPLADAVGGTTPFVFDAHEHRTSESASWSRLRRLSMRGAQDWIFDRYVPRAAGMMTVSPGIVRDFEGLASVHPALVTNAPYFQALDPSQVTEPIRLFHVGVADERRRLENTLEAVRSLGDRFTFDVFLARENEYRRRLERLVASEDHIRVLPPVPQADLVSIANAYDVGVHFLPVEQPNHVHALPNKLFDYIQARLALAVGPSPTMAEVVREWDCGVVSSSMAPEALARTLVTLTVPEVERMKRNSDRAARVLTADNNRETVVSLVRQAIVARRATR